MTGLQVIVPLKLGLKFSYSSDLKHCVVWLSHTSSHSGWGEAGLRIFTGFREFRPTAGLQVIVPLKLGLKNILIGLT